MSGSVRACVLQGWPLARHSVELFQAGASHSQLWIVEGAAHTGAAYVNPAEFERRVVGWFQQHDQPR